MSRGPWCTRKDEAGVFIPAGVWLLFHPALSTSGFQKLTEFLSRAFPMAARSHFTQDLGNTLGFMGRMASARLFSVFADEALSPNLSAKV